jgi:hypothetical protein
MQLWERGKSERDPGRSHAGSKKFKTFFVTHANQVQRSLAAIRKQLLVCIHNTNRSMGLAENIWPNYFKQQG